jgi:hypothetical protein
MRNIRNMRMQKLEAVICQLGPNYQAERENALLCKDDGKPFCP